MTLSATGGPAQTVYPVASRQGVIGRDAVRTVVVTDGRAAEGGPQQAVYYVSDAEIAAGEFVISGNPPIPIVEVGAFGTEYPPIAVYAEGRPVVVPSGPQFDSAEIGAVNASTLVVTFDQNVDASNYATGVTIKVNGVSASITSAIRQSDNHAKVNYLIPVLWHGSGDAVTWEYASGTGNIIAESDSTPLGNVSAQSVTNNCEYAALLDLQSDTLTLNDGDPVSTWADQSGQGHNFTQTGTPRPTKQTVSTYPVVSFDGSEDILIGQDFTENLLNICIIIAGNNPSVISAGSTIVGKFDGDSGTGWIMDMFGFEITLYQGENTVSADLSSIQDNDRHVFTGEIVSLSETHIFIDGSNFNESLGSSGTVTSISSSQPVALGGESNLAGANGKFNFNGVLILTMPSATNRAALEARLAARYGITM